MIPFEDRPRKPKSRLGPLPDEQRCARCGSWFRHWTSTSCPPCRRHERLDRVVLADIARERRLERRGESGQALVEVALVVALVSVAVFLFLQWAGIT